MQVTNAGVLDPSVYKKVCEALDEALVQHRIPIGLEASIEVSGDPARDRTEVTTMLTFRLYNRESLPNGSLQTMTHERLAEILGKHIGEIADVGIRVDDLIAGVVEAGYQASLKVKP